LKQNQENVEKKPGRLEELYEYGRKKGILTSKEVMDRLTEAEMEPDQLDKILETLEAYGVSVVNDESDIPVTPSQIDRIQESRESHPVDLGEI
jgi:RNA polymerase primary sigma factor